jgi:hypothetical protein
MAVSDGLHLDMPPLLTTGEQRSYDQIAVIRARQARRREDWLHKQTTDPERLRLGPPSR